MPANYVIGIVLMSIGVTLITVGVIMKIKQGR
jgi:xanthine/uracil permease